MAVAPAVVADLHHVIPSCAWLQALVTVSLTYLLASISLKYACGCSELVDLVKVFS